MYYNLVKGKIKEHKDIKDVDLEGRLFYGFEVGLKKGRFVRRVQINGHAYEVDDVVLTDGERYWGDDGELVELKSTDNLTRYIKID